MNKCRILASSTLLGLLLLAGCANQYVITMTNASTMRAKTRPKLDAQGYYTFKDTSGQDVRLNGLRVRSIEAVSKGENARLPFQR